MSVKSRCFLRPPLIVYEYFNDFPNIIYIIQMLFKLMTQKVLFTSLQTFSEKKNFSLDLECLRYRGSIPD